MTDYNDPTTDTNNAKNDNSVYKKWHKTGLINIGYWPDADKVTVEVGSLDDGGRLKSATKCYLPLFKFLAYLRAEISRNVSHIYPSYGDKGEQFFGGGKGKDGALVSRVFTTEFWTKGDPASGRRFKCGEYAGKSTDQGAILPDYKTIHSENQIKMTASDLAEVYEILSIHAQAAYAARAKSNDGSAAR